MLIPYSELFEPTSCERLREDSVLERRNACFTVLPNALTEYPHAYRCTVSFEPLQKEGSTGSDARQFS
jgi:hypothetical protein